MGAEAAAADRRGRRDRARHRLRRLADRPRRRRRLVRDDHERRHASPQVGPTAVSVTQLGTLSDKAGHPIYWAGPVPGTRYELTQTTSGSIYVRYLPQGVPDRDQRAGTRSSAAIRSTNAYKVLQGLAKKDGEISFPAPGSGIAVYSQSSPDERLPRVPGLERPDRGLRPVAGAGAGPDHVGPDRACSVAECASRRLGRLPAAAGGALARLRTARSRSPPASGCPGRSCCPSG